MLLIPQSKPKNDDVMSAGGIGLKRDKRASAQMTFGRDVPSDRLSGAVCCDEGRGRDAIVSWGARPAALVITVGGLVYHTHNTCSGVLSTRCELRRGCL